MNPTTLKCLLTLIKTQGYSNTRDLIARGILEQWKSNAETQLMSEKILFQWTAWRSVEGKIRLQNSAVKCCVHLVALMRSAGWAPDGVAGWPGWWLPQHWQCFTIPNVTLLVGASRWREELCLLIIFLLAYVISQIINIHKIY